MSSSVNGIISCAEERESVYDWIGAVEFYLKALDALSEQDFSRQGEICKLAGFAYVRAAMQAEDTSEFKKLMGEADVFYQKAMELYGRVPANKGRAWLVHCQAMITYIRHWLATGAAEKQKLIKECWQLTKEALKAFEESDNSVEYAKTYNELSLSAFLEFVSEWDFQTARKIIKEATEAGERAINLLSRTPDKRELTRTYVRTAFYRSAFGYYFAPEMEGKEQARKVGQDFWLKAKDLSEEEAFLELSRIPSAKCDEYGWSMDEMLTNHGKAFDYAKRTRDKFMMGIALDWLLYATGWKAIRTDNPDKKRELFQKALRYAEEVKRLFSPMCFISARADLLWSGAPIIEYNFFVADLETDLKKRRNLLESAVTYESEATNEAEDAGYPTVIEYVHHAVSKAQASLAKMETIRERKKCLLESALQHRKKDIEISEQVHPFIYWDTGVVWNYLADLELELSNLEENMPRRKEMLESAVSHKNRALQLAIKEIQYWENLGELSFFAALGGYQYTCGDLLIHLHILTNDNNYLKEAVKVLVGAADSYRKLTLHSRVAECYWKVARSLDTIGDHLEAAENFKIASKNYASASEKIMQFKEFYQDYAIYMEAWSEIEKARFYHERQEYRSAYEHFEKAATLHENTKRWAYLAPNYRAWTQLECAEDLSRKEQSEEALEAFEEAAQRFIKTKESLRKELRKTEDPGEKQTITEMVTATEPRLEYCRARTYIEEAKILDKKGEHYSSSQKYGSASDSFKKAQEMIESPKDKKEFELIAKLSEAWQEMTSAEADASLTGYLRASRLFEEVKELSLNEKTKMLVLAHSRFCLALAAGTEFIDTRDRELHDKTIHHLESAANYYLKAGFEKASEYAEATELLFDAYIHIDDAKREADPEKKVRLYAMAEKVLQTSAGSFARAEHLEKRDQVSALLETVRQERELALSLNEILHAPSLVSTTSTFATPPPTYEKAVGLDRFEHTDIQANLSMPQEVEVGREFDVRLDLVNVAKNFGLLVRVIGLVPSGFKVVDLPSQYLLQEDSLEIKGKRLDPLKVESIKVSLQATAVGSFNIKPQVIYVDNAGNFRTCKPDQVTLTTYPQLEFEFKNEGARKAFAFLTKAFIDDYMHRRLPLEKSGWKTMMDIVRQGKIPQYSVYGTKGQRGTAIAELERRGIVEARVFSGERGRGGKILKIRVFYEKEIVKRQIDQQVMKNQQK
ncbi:MAG: hypothetical protein ABSF44_08620 [Candidatus Bathyarchaeia archaeon]|jgi:tetratricopeptide (TPR) repeat protein